MGIYFQVGLVLFVRYLNADLLSSSLQDSNGEVVVNHIIMGGSADRSGVIRLGDVVVTVDSKDVRGKVIIL